MSLSADATQVTHPTPHPTRERTESRTSKKNPFSRMQHEGSWCRAGGWAVKTKLFAGIFWWVRRRELRVEVSLFQENSAVRGGKILVFSLVNEWTKTWKSRGKKIRSFWIRNHCHSWKYWREWAVGRAAQSNAPAFVAASFTCPTLILHLRCLNALHSATSTVSPLMSFSIWNSL